MKINNFYKKVFNKIKSFKVFFLIIFLSILLVLPITYLVIWHLNSITIGIFNGYIPDETISAFEAKENVKINTYTYETDDEFLNKHQFSHFDCYMLSNHVGTFLAQEKGSGIAPLSNEVKTNVLTSYNSNVPKEYQKNTLYDLYQDPNRKEPTGDAKSGTGVPTQYLNYGIPLAWGDDKIALSKDLPAPSSVQKSKIWSFVQDELKKGVNLDLFDDSAVFESFIVSLYINNNNVPSVGHDLSKAIQVKKVIDDANNYLISILPNKKNVKFFTDDLVPDHLADTNTMFFLNNYNFLVADDLSKLKLINIGGPGSLNSSVLTWSDNFYIDDGISSKKAVIIAKLIGYLLSQNRTIYTNYGTCPSVLQVYLDIYDNSGQGAIWNNFWRIYAPIDGKGATWLPPMNIQKYVIPAAIDLKDKLL